MSQNEILDILTTNYERDPHVIGENIIKTHNIDYFNIALKDSITRIHSAGQNLIANLIYTKNNLTKDKIKINKVFIEDPSESIDTLLKLVNENKTKDAYNIFSVYTNINLTQHPKLKGYKIMLNPGLSTLLKTIRDDFRSQNDYPGDEELITDLIYKSTTDNTYIFITNTYMPESIARSSNISFLRGHCFQNVKEQVLYTILPTLFPEIHDQLNPQELYLLQRLANIFRFNTTNILNKLRELISSVDYKTFIHLLTRKSIEQNIKNARRAVYENNSARLELDIRNIEQQLERKEAELLTLQKEKYYMQYVNTTLTEDLDYLYNHPLIVTILNSESGPGILKLQVRLPISLWDQDIANNIFENLDNIMEDNNINTDYKPRIKTFFEEVFIKQSTKYYIQSEVNLDLIRFEHFQIRNHTTIDNETNLNICHNLKAGYNPHLEFFGCVGTYAQHIRDALRLKDIPTVIEAVLSPLKNWNLADGAVLRRSLRILMPVLFDISCLEYEGNLYTLNELHELLHPEELKESEEETEEGDDTLD